MLDRGKVREVFAQAAELPGDQVASFLDRACAGDTELRREVESLLEAAALRPAFFGSPTATLPGAAGEGTGGAAGEGVGTTLGRYRLVQEIGQGGFGTVYVAEQTEPVRRRVALKIVKLGMDTRAVIARFEAERQALALMDHAHIARVFDAGTTESGRPYFVMELVNGLPITAYCDARGLSISSRLELFTQVCHAVQHAHSKGIIHRDLKPSNVLVATEDDRPLVKVIDFGVAKATNIRLTEKTLFSEERQMVGTLEYMSPEQAGGEVDIDTRTDVYSLGVLLYELLTGATPFDAGRLRSAAFAEVQRIIREDDPPAPSTKVSRAGEGLVNISAQRGTEPSRLATSIRGELDWIVLRTLEKDRGRRYESAGNLAADIERYLDGRPIEAAPASTMYRLRKLFRRHRLAASAGTMVAASLVLGLGFALWQAGVAARERDAARSSASAALEAKRESEARQKETEQVARFQAAQLAELRPALMGDRLREDLVAEARAASKRAGSGTSAADESVARLEQELRTLNLTNVSLRVLDRNIFQSALAAAEREFRDQPLVKATLLLSLAQAMREAGLYKEVEAPLSEAIAIRSRMLGEEHELTLDALGEKENLLASTGKLDEGETLMRRVYEVRLRTSGLKADTTLTDLSNLVVILGMRGKLDEAEGFVRTFLDRARGQLDDADPRMITALGHLGRILMERGKLEEAEKYLRDATERSAGFKGADESIAVGHATAYGQLLLRQGRFPEAEQATQQALDRARRVAGDDAMSTIIAMNNLGAVYAQSGKTAEAAVLNRKLLETCRRVLGAQHPTTSVVLGNVAFDHMKAGEFVQAEKCYRDALATSRAVYGPDHESTILNMYSLGVALRQQAKLEEAESVSREALQRATAALPEDHRWRITAAIGLGQVLTAQGRFVEAETTFMLAEAALRPAGPEFPNANPAARARYLKWAKALDEMYGKWSEAEPGARSVEAARWKEAVQRLEGGRGERPGK
jgi:eukaryotic-like serine/threonine-protein kinase